MIAAVDPAENIPPDTQAVLLLCATFTREEASGPKPLTPREYNAVAAWLNRQGRRPADLLNGFDAAGVAGEPDAPDAERVQALLARGVQMAAAVERWQRLGLWVLSRAEERFPERLRRVLRSAAPPLLFGAGDPARLSGGGLAVVGSRNAEDEALEFTRRAGVRCAACGVPVISGGARGVDQAALFAALEAGGTALAVPADRLDRLATSRDTKEWIRGGTLTLASPYEPEAAFTIGRAMGRNKVLYALGDFALVVRFATGEGGTWSGAVEHLNRSRTGESRVPVFVRREGNPEDGCKQLLERGALPFPDEEFFREPIGEVLQRQVPMPAPPLASAPAPPNANLPPATDTCYTRCLPLVLEALRAEPGDKELSELATRLEITAKQLKDWLQRAIGEGKVRKRRKDRREVYTDAALPEDPNLFHHDGDAA